MVFIRVMIKFDPHMAQYTIGIKNLEVLSPTGVHEEERMLKVRLSITATLTFPNIDHLPVSLHTTFDYSKLALLIADVCKQPNNLLEQVANNIITKLHPIIDKPCQLQLRIEKLNPMPGETMHAAYIDVIDEMSPGKGRR